MREIKKTYIRRHPCLWIGRLSIFKVLIVLKLMFRFNAATIIILADLFVKIYKWFWNIHGNAKTFKTSKTLFKKNKLDDLKTSYNFG